MNMNEFRIQFIKFKILVIQEPKKIECLCRKKAEL